MALVLNGKFPYAPACGSGTNEAGHLIAGGQSAAHAGRHTLRVEDLAHVENILRTRMGPLGDSRPSTWANQRVRDTVQRPTSSQGSTAGMRSRRIKSRGRGARGGRRSRKARAWRGASANRSEQGSSPKSPIELSDDAADMQLRREGSREL